jgi:hypothetical protein
LKVQAAELALEIDLWAERDATVMNSNESIENVGVLDIATGDDNHRDRCWILG